MASRTRSADLPIAILAGGLATRLRPLTDTIPKLLLEVAGEPFFSHQLRLLKKSGVTRVVVCVGHLGDMIVDRYGDGSDWGLHIDYSFDGPKLLGTGGALRRALPLLGDAFLVLYGDSYLPINYLEVAERFIQSGTPGLMTVYANDGKFDISNVEFRDGQIVAYDKHRPTPQMRHIDYGLGALQSGTLEMWPQGEPFDLADVYHGLAAENQLAGHEVHHRFYEIGSVEGLRELDSLLRARNPEA